MLTKNKKNKKTKTKKQQQKTRKFFFILMKFQTPHPAQRAICLECVRIIKHFDCLLLAVNLAIALIQHASHQKLQSVFLGVGK